MYIRDELKGSSYLVYDIQTALRSVFVDIIDGGSSTITGTQFTTIEGGDSTLSVNL
jgi:hypothetical protein